MKVGIIGIGRVGYEFGLDKNRGPCASHFHCYKKLGAEIAVCDSDTEKLKKFTVDEACDEFICKANGSVVRMFQDYESLLKNFQPELVSICTPTNTHYELALAAAECPSVQTIFLEKPIAQSLGEADDIIRACQNNNKRLAVNYSRRWSKTYANVRKEVHIPLNMIGLHPGPLVRTGTHMIDLLNWFAYQAPLFDWDNVEVHAFGEQHLAPYMSETEDFNLNGYIKYGVANAVLLGNLSAIEQKTVVFELTAWNKDAEFKVTENGCRSEIYMIAESKRYAGLSEYRRVYIEEAEPENLLLNAVTELVGQLGAGRFTCKPEEGYELKTKPVTCSGLDARRDLQVALALHYSATNGNKIVKLADVPYEYTVRSY